RAFAQRVRSWAPAPALVIFFRTEAHALAFHVGRPLTVLIDWNDLEAHLAAPGPRYLVMPPDCAAAWPVRLRKVRLVEVLRNTELSAGRHERPLVLLRKESLVPGP